MSSSPITVKTPTAPTPKPRRANPESDTMTDEATTAEAEPTLAAMPPTPDPKAPTDEQAQRAALLHMSKSVLSEGAGLAAAFGGAKLPERFTLEDLFDATEYVRTGVVTSRFHTRDNTIVDHHLPDDQLEKLVNEKLAERPAAEGCIPIPFKRAIALVIDADAPDDEFKAAVKGARKALKQLAADRGVDL